MLPRATVSGIAVSWMGPQSIVELQPSQQCIDMRYSQETVCGAGLTSFRSVPVFPRQITSRYRCTKKTGMDTQAVRS